MKILLFFFQLKTMKEALAANQDSKHALERNLRKLNHQLESKGMEDLQMKQRVENLARELKRREEKESKLKNEVQRREEKLRKAKRCIFLGLCPYCIELICFTLCENRNLIQVSLGCTMYLKNYLLFMLLFAFPIAT